MQGLFPGGDVKAGRLSGRACIPNAPEAASSIVDHFVGEDAADMTRAMALVDQLNR
jgi:hypothetical protein